MSIMSKQSGAVFSSGSSHHLYQTGDTLCRGEWCILSSHCSLNPTRLYRNTQNTMWTPFSMQQSGGHVQGYLKKKNQQNKNTQINNKQSNNNNKMSNCDRVNDRGACWYPDIVRESACMVLLPDTQNCGLRMRWEYRERFPSHRRLAIPTCITCMAHVPWCMPRSLTVGFIWSRWRGKRSRHSRRMRNPQFCVSGKRPMVITKFWSRTLEGLILNITCILHYIRIPDDFISGDGVTTQICIVYHLYC